jgi:hypothetical protein
MNERDSYNFEIAYAIAGEVFQFLIRGEDIGEALDAATREMRRRHAGRGRVIRIEQSNVPTVVTPDGRRVIVRSPWTQ